MVQEISFDRIYHTLKDFSKILPKVSLEKQKQFLHTLLTKLLFIHLTGTLINSRNLIGYYVI